MTYSCVYIQQIFVQKVIKATSVNNQDFSLFREQRESGRFRIVFPPSAAIVPLCPPGYLQPLQVDNYTTNSHYDKGENRIN